MVLDLAAPIPRFAAAAARAGFPVLGEWDDEDVNATDIGFVALSNKGEPKKDQNITCHIYLSSFNLTAINEFRRLYAQWRDGAAWPADGTTPWRDLFNCVRDIRPWGLSDRIRESGLLDDWREQLSNGAAEVNFEVDFWYRPNTAEQRAGIGRQLAQLVEQNGGRVTSETTIESIKYHGALGQIPVRAIRNLETLEGLEFAHYDEIFELHPVTQAVPRIIEPLELITGTPRPAPVVGGRRPVAALMDGAPMQNHPDLVGRVQVEDSDGIEQRAPAAHRVHGTAMASIILNGDFGANEPPLDRTLVARPVLLAVPNLRGTSEIFPTDRLAIDTFHRGLMDVLEPAGLDPNNRTICVINVSLGDPHRLFLRKMSPWARLIDWAAYRFRVLFIISAGNRLDALRLSIERNFLAGTTPEDLQDDVLLALYQDRRNRTLLAPAESINALTVGATHNDSSDVGLLPNQIDPIACQELPSPISPLGLGYGNTIKPDILAAGGRQIYQEPVAYPQNERSVILEAQKFGRSPGILVACPATPLAGSPRTFMRGTSVAAAMVTRLAIQIYDALEAMDGGASAILPAFAGVVLKAMVAHTATWGDNAEGILRSVLESKGVPGLKLKENISRFIGHGCIRPQRASVCTDQRVTVIGFGELSDGDAHLFRLPWPEGLRAQTELRRLTITVASLVPTLPGDYQYRAADVWVAKPTECKEVGLNAGDRDYHAVQRGTLQHICYSGSKAADFDDGAHLTFQVNCRSVQNQALPPGMVPYALVVSIEVPETSMIPVYAQVELALRTQVQLALPQ
jgi:hypothetical protein